MGRIGNFFRGGLERAGITAPHVSRVSLYELSTRSEVKGKIDTVGFIFPNSGKGIHLNSVVIPEHPEKLHLNIVNGMYVLYGVDGNRPNARAVHVRGTLERSSWGKILRVEKAEEAKKRVV